jgi:hypothetical protein
MQAEREIRWREHRAQYAENKDKLRTGEFSWVLSPAQAYLGRCSDVGRELPAHARIAEWLGEELQQYAFEGFEAFLKTPPVKPSAEEIAESYAAGRRWHATDILVAALAERHRRGIGFDDLTDERVIAGYLPIAHDGLLDSKIEGLQTALEESLRQREYAWEYCVRLFIEPELRARRVPIFGLGLIMRDKRDAELAKRLATEWLTMYPDMARETEAVMFERLLRSGAFSELRALRPGREMNDDDIERMRNWDVIALLTDFDAAAAALKGIGAKDRDFIWALRRILGGRRGEEFSLPVPPQLLAWIFREFRISCPFSPHPLGGVYGDGNSWDASDYLIALVNRLGSDVSDLAIKDLASLSADPPDDYMETLKVASAEQEAKRAEADYRPPKISDIISILNLGPPATINDLQAVIIEELTEVQMRIKGDDVDSWRHFFTEEGDPHGEEVCRDYLITLLRQGCRDIELTPEAHVAADKEVDIGCSVADLYLPIEIKGQWHNGLWHAADSQLDRLYASDWRAGRRGIYLVLWFGDGVTKRKQLKPPPKGSPKATTPEELRQMVVAMNRCTKDGRVEVFVLDLTRDA